MTRSSAVIACVVAALAVLGAVAPSQTKPDIVGSWTGYAVSPGMRFELTAVFAKAETGYTGKLSDSTGTLADVPLRDIVFKDGKLAFEFDLTMGVETMLIKIDLALEGDTLKGYWLDVEGNSDVVELVRQK